MRQINNFHRKFRAQTDKISFDFILCMSQKCDLFDILAQRVKMANYALFFGSLSGTYTWHPGGHLRKQKVFIKSFLNVPLD